MSDDTPTVEKPAEGAQPAPAGNSALPEAEIDLSFPKIISEHIDDAVRPRLGWR
jgi:hypothetical protein